jgi:hypothetical protein
MDKKRHIHRGNNNKMTHNKPLQREVELIWNGKTSDVTNIVLPIEQVDEPRKSKPLMGANTRESGKIIRVHSRLLVV